MHQVLIIANDRLTRAYLRAQLEEEGFDTTLTTDLLDAALRLRDDGIDPDIIVIDTQELEIEPEILDTLRELAGQTQLLIIQSATDFPVKVRWDGHIERLSRPVSIEQMVNLIKQLTKNH